MYISKEGLKYEIVKRVCFSTSLVRFVESGNIRVCFNRDISTGDIYDKILGVGFINGDVEEYETARSEKSYVIWAEMIKRCYSGKQKAYSNVSVCEEWHNYLNFAKWYNENHIEGWDLDKDLLSGEKKIYSPDTCCFLPKIINSALTRSANVKILKDKKGYYFYMYSLGEQIKIYSNNKSEATRMAVLYRYTNILTLVSVFKKQLGNSIIGKLINIYEGEAGEIFTNTRHLKRERYTSERPCEISKNER